MADERHTAPNPNQVTEQADWYTEEQAEDMRFSLRTVDVLHSSRSPFQQVDLVQTSRYGRMLALDGLVQTTEVDEFCYHEMIAHPALLIHPDPQRVLVIGGGDGGTVREVLKHRQVKEVVMVEIDGLVVDLAKEFLPGHSRAFNDPRLDLKIGDGVVYVEEAPGQSFDVMIVDSSEPIGAGVQLFSETFYRNASRALKAGGILVVQSESPFVNDVLIRRIQRSLRRVFKFVHLYHAYVPTYPSGCWTFSIASNDRDVAHAEPRQATFETRYYTQDVHRGAFALPPFMAELCRDASEDVQ